MIARKKVRLTVGVLLSSLAVLLLAAAPATSGGRVYMPGCGSAYYPAVKPSKWSPGCAGASPFFQKLRWRRWGRSVTIARGSVLVCGNGATGSCDRSRGGIRASRIRSCEGENGEVRIYTRILFSVGGRVSRMKIPCY